MGINQKSKKYLDDFTEYLKDEKNFSTHTLRAYCADVLTFLIWVNEANIEEIDTKKFSEYLYFIGQLNYTKTTIARKIASIRAFYRFLYREEIIDFNPTDTVSGPKRTKNLPNFLSDNEVETI